MQPHDVTTQSFLNSLVGVGVTLALLYWAKAVLIPVALALLGCLGDIGTENRFKECSPYHSGRVRANKTVNCGHMHPEHLGDLFSRLAFTQ